MSLSVSAPFTPPGSLRSPTSPERGGEMPFDVLRVRGGCRLPYEGSCPRRGLRGGGMSLTVSAPFTPPGSLHSPTSPERGGENAL